MDVEIFAICDAATMNADKMNLLGPFDSINSAVEPITFPSCSMAIRMRFQRSEAGSHALQILVLDDSGKEVLPAIRADIDAMIPGARAPSSIVHLVVGIAPLKLPHFGEYRIVLQIDGQTQKSLPLRTRRLQKPPAPPAP